MGRTLTNTLCPEKAHSTTQWETSGLANTHLVVIGRHTFRTLESYDRDPDAQPSALEHAAARGAVISQEQGTGIPLPSHSDITPDLDTFIVSQQPVPEQMADTIHLFAQAQYLATPIPLQPDIPITDNDDEIFMDRPNTPSTSEARPHDTATQKHEDTPASTPDLPHQEWMEKAILQVEAN